MKNFLFLLVLLSTATAYSHGVCIVDADNSDYLTLRKSDIDVTVRNQIATVSSLQTFYNDSSDSLKIKYAFPLPSNANPIYFRFRIEGEDWQEAVFNAAGQNSDLPGSGSSGGGLGSSSGTASPGLSSYLGATPFYFTFGNYLPTEKNIEIEIVYVQLLEYEFGIVQFHYPNDYSVIQSEVEVLEFNMELYSGREISTLEVIDHEVEYDMQSNYAQATFVDEENITVDTDFVINYSLASDDLGSYPMSTKLPDSTDFCDNHGAGFLTMILEPESNDSTEVIEKNFCLVIDRSGSMQGDKMVQAKDAATFIVNNLNEGDYFNIIEFSSSVGSFENGMVPADDGNTAAAALYIDALRTGGTTNISESLEEAIGNFGGLDTTKANIIIFFTDGKPTAGLEATSAIVDAVDNTVQDLETGIFLFTFGVGEGVNKALLTTLAIENSGLASFLEKEDLEEEITDFFLKINNPVLINTEVSFDPPIITDIFPSPLPNLYEGQQLIVSGRYTDASPVQMTLKGQFYNQLVEYNFDLNLSDSLDAQYSVLPQIWAKQKIDALTIMHHLAATESEQNFIQDEIDTIGACYGVVSVEFNSFTDQTLEIDYADFNLYDHGNKTVLVSWSTTAEINNDKFVIQRSRDAKEWEDIATLSGQEKSDELLHYEHLDHNPYIGVNYYRIVTVDVYGEISYSETQAIVIDQQEEVLLYPNPVLADGQLYISSKTTEPLSVRIHTIDGKLMHSAEVLHTGTIAMENYQPGVYIVVMSQGKFRKIEQVVVE